MPELPLLAAERRGEGCSASETLGHEWPTGKSAGKATFFGGGNHETHEKRQRGKATDETTDFHG